MISESSGSSDDEEEEMLEEERVAERWGRRSDEDEVSL